MGWEYLGVLLIVALVLCAVGFYKYVYFLSVGYGLAIAGCGIGILVLTLRNGWAGSLIWLVIVQALLFVVYGWRLSGFLIVREMKSAAYRNVMKDEIKADKKMPFFVLLAIWLSVGVLYVAQTSAVFFRFYNRSEDFIVPLVGIGISVVGLLLESISDMQKSAQKKERPDMVATKGLFRISRCPNYWGEVTFWTGIFVSGVTTYKGMGQWITAVLAYICIFYIMVNGAQRLERRQNKRYGSNPEYVEYANKTPILLPFIPIYHLNKRDHS